MIKDIIFDLGNVLLFDNPSHIMNILTLSDYEKELVGKQFFNNWEKLDLGEETLLEHFNNCHFNIKIDDVTKDKLIKYYKYRPYNMEILDIMKRLKQNGYNIYILSDNNIDTYKYLKGLKELSFVDGWALSCEFHKLKENGNLIKELFNNYNLKPGECFFIDDKKENIEMGKTFGMKGHKLDYSKFKVDALIEDLIKNNIRI
jgi:putative hydrolase of the HAD superfamily